MIVSADNGREAIRLVESDPSIDIVLMDIMMPEMDGIATMQEIRKLPRGRELPMVAVTAKAMKGDRQKCIEAGAWDYLSKPVDPMHLLAVLGAGCAAERRTPTTSAARRRRARQHPDRRRPAREAARLQDRARGPRARLVCVRSGARGAAEILKREFAVILLDVNMPDIDGFETADADPQVQALGAHADHLRHRRTPTRCRRAAATRSARSTTSSRRSCPTCCAPR